MECLGLNLLNSNKMKIKRITNRLKKGIFVLLTVCAASIGYGQNAPVTLTAGDTAPAIKVLKWVKGTPVETFNKDKIYVLEFWATWCGPCKEAMPGLSELARKYPDKVIVIGMDIWEKTNGKPYETALPYVTRFAAGMGKDMDYNVAMDNNDQYMANKWMVASGQSGIPATFMIKEGKIIWIGHPVNLEKTLESVFAGTFDAQAFAATYGTKSKAQQATKAELYAVLDPVLKAKSDKNYAREIFLVDFVHDSFTIKFPEYKGALEKFKFEALTETNIPAAIAFAKEWHKNSPNWADASVPMAFLQKDGLPKEAYQLAVDYLSEIALMPGAPIPIDYDAMGKLYFKMGDIPDAISIEEKAVASAITALKEGKYKGSVLKETVTEYQDTLAKYKNAKN